MLTKENLWTIFESMMLETTIGKRADEGGRTFILSATELHEASVRKVMAYGFQRWLNDRIGGSDTTIANKIADTSLFLAKVKDGTWVHVARESVDHVQAWNRKAALVILKSLAKTDSKVKAALGDKDTMTAYVDNYVESNHARVEATAIKLRAIDEAYRASVAELAIDTSDGL